jgi:parallel beta-helix repeat protein/predicted outer membrane repeat protein
MGADEYMLVYNADSGLGYINIQDAIDDANDGNTITVTEGTYYESIDFGGKAITVRSTNPDDDDVVASTIIDANGAGRVVTFNDGEDVNSVLTGFTITGGYVSYPSDGAGIYCSGSSPTISRCVIYDNNCGDDGGGICCYNSSSPLISACLITSNEAGDGGGICCNSSSSPAISNCEISDNDSDDKGGGIYCKSSSCPTIEDCEISSNTALKGGGIYCNASEPQIERCIFNGNQTSGTGSDPDGGGIYCMSSNPNIFSCIIYDNFSDDDGGGIWCDASDPNIINCTLTKNEADDKGGGIYCKNGSDAEITNCILWDDTATSGAEIYTSSSSPVVSYSDVEGGWAGPNNINTDPNFVDPENNDFHLDEDSPCIDVGDPNGNYTGQTDIDGDNRVIDIAGKGDGTVDVDMGGDEYKE